MILIITLSTFAFITLGVLAAYWLMFKPASAATERLRQMGEAGRGAAAGAVGASAATQPAAKRLVAPRRSASGRARRERKESIDGEDVSDGGRRPEGPARAARCDG